MIQYEIDPKWQEVFDDVQKIGNVLRTDAITKNFNPEAEYKRLLTIATGCFVYLVTEFKRWSAVKTNNEAEKFCSLKEDGGPKFSAAAANPEASLFVAKERYYRDILEGHKLACESVINTLKKFIENNNREDEKIV